MMLNDMEFRPRFASKCAQCPWFVSLFCFVLVPEYILEIDRISILTP